MRTNNMVQVRQQGHTTEPRHSLHTRLPVSTRNDTDFGPVFIVPTQARPGRARPWPTTHGSQAYRCMQHT